MSADVRRPAYDFRTTELIVKPRKSYKDERSIIAVARGSVWTEANGEVSPVEQLPELLLTNPASIIVCENSPAMLLELDAKFHNYPGWSWRVTPVTRRKFKNYRTTTLTETRNVIVNYFGWRYPRGNSETNFVTHYHYPIDTMTFLGGSIGKSFPDADPLSAIIAWGMDVREFCVDNGLKVSPTTGGLAAQLLRDSRFFPLRRRKVPQATNDKARPHLPGNHYELFVPEGVTQPKSYYLDMRGAHHYAAAKLTFPHPDRLYARGNFREPPTTVPKYLAPWAPFGSPKCTSILKTHGLFLLRLNVPGWVHKTTKKFPPPWLRQQSGIRLAYVYSNELPILAEYGVVLEGVEAAWTASTTDDGLNRYASWSITETAEMSPLRKSWAKATLLSAYGLLAARPRHREFGYREVRGGGIPHVYLSSGGPIAVQAMRTVKELDSAVANVIARGMIEAEVRREVLTMANDLASRGAKILALYADSVIVDASSPLPLLAEPWSVKSELTGLNFFNAVSFESRELTRLPGIPDRDVIDRLTNRERFRDALTRRRETR